MSQSGTFFSGLSPSGPVTTLTGNTGGPVAPTVGNINIVGAGFIDVVGTPGTSTLTISSSGAAADQFDADVGTAIPVAGILNIVGSTNINTLGSGNTIEIFLDDDVVITGSFTAGTTAGFITAVTGDISADAGNFNLPNTLSTGDEGIITFGGNHYIQNFGGNFFLGNSAGNLTLTVGTAINNVVLGDSGLHDVTVGHNNTCIGFDGMLSVTSGSVNTGVGSSVLAGITSGSNNTALGAGSGSALLTNESNNILIGNPGVVADQNTIRIGVTGSGTLEQNECFIAAIFPNGPATTPNFVLVESDDRLSSTPAGAFANVYDTDSGTAIPSISTINIDGGNNINTSGATDVVTINLDDTVSIAGSMTAGTGLTVTTGDITASAGNLVCTAGNLILPFTTSSSVGVISLDGIVSFIHSFGTNNTFLGGDAGNFISSGSTNTGVGVFVLNALTTGSGNVSVGGLSNITSGSNNTTIGTDTGLNYTSSESNNILIGTSVHGTVAESNVVRIGNQGSGPTQQNKCFIAGITGVTVTGSAVLCSTTGALGTIASSVRYKENIYDISTKSKAILSLSPKVFNYKEDETKKIHYGLIAEEVEEIFPDLVLYGEDGTPESVAYHELPVLLLNEFQQAFKRIEELERKIR